MKFSPLWVLYALLALTILAYAAYNNALIGMVAVALIVVTLAVEFRTSVKEEGAKKSIYEVGIALVAVLVAWVIVSFVLETSSPLNVVASCSMLPNLHRGDLVVLHGITNMQEFLSSHHVPVVNMTGSGLSSFYNISREWLVYLPYYSNNPSSLAAFNTNPFTPFVVRNGSYEVGLYDFRCIAYYSYRGVYSYFSRCEVNQTSQEGAPIKYFYSVEKLYAANGTVSNVIVTESIKIANVTINENYSNPIIVYATAPNDSYPKSDIIHRLVAAVRDGNNYYLLTKGDNNPYFDLQVANYPVNQSSVIGYVIGSVPVLGYVKILLSGQISSVAGCNETIVR